MNNLDWVGWAASAILIVTLVKQIHTQWHADEVEAVSPWLFVGQIAASTGFVVYSLSVQNWVFVVTNSLILCTAVAGQILYWLRSKKQKIKF